MSLAPRTAADIFLMPAPTSEFNLELTLLARNGIRSNHFNAVVHSISRRIIPTRPAPSRGSPRAPMQIGAAGSSGNQFSVLRSSEDDDDDNIDSR